jgi:polygalacturonase
VLPADHRIAWNGNALQNRPLVYLGPGVTDASVRGPGAIERTYVIKANGERDLDSSIFITAIATFEAQHVSVVGVVIRNALLGYNIMTIASRYVTVADNTIEALDIGSDGIVVENSQNVSVLRNMVSNGDDAIYVVTSFRDPRGPTSGWWTRSSHSRRRTSKSLSTPCERTRTQPARPRWRLASCRGGAAG